MGQKMIALYDLEFEFREDSYPPLASYPRYRHHYGPSMKLQLLAIRGSPQKPRIMYELAYVMFDSHCPMTPPGGARDLSNSLQDHTIASQDAFCKYVECLSSVLPCLSSCKRVLSKCAYGERVVRRGRVI